MKLFRWLRLPLAILALIAALLFNINVPAKPAHAASFYYDRTTAVNWALTYAPLNSSNDMNGAETCTWFTSLVLWYGGFPTDSQWNWRGTHGFRHPVPGTETAWVSSELVNYLTSGAPFSSEVTETPLSFDNGGFVNTPIQPGDIIAYDLGYNPVNDAADPTGGHSFTPDHLAVVVDVLHDPNNGDYPEVAEWGHLNDYTQYVNGTYVDTGRPADYAKRGWTWSETNQTWLQTEDNGPEYGGRDPNHAGINIEAYLIHFNF